MNAWQLPKREALRTKILNLISSSKTRSKEAATVLAQCQRHVQDMTKIKDILVKCRLRHKDILSGKHLECHLILRRNRAPVGFICKEWDKPWFEVGSIVLTELSAVAPAESAVDGFMKFCEKRYVCVRVIETDGTHGALKLVTPVGAEDLNENVLEIILSNVDECANAAKSLFKG